MDKRVVKLAGLEDDSITNGPGLRFVLFTQGCPHHCPGCHNPQTHPFSGGKEYTVDQIFQRIIQNPLETGVTFSGGEPFCQAAPLAELAEMLKARGYEVAVYTGFTFEYLKDSMDAGIQKLLHNTDVLVDGKFILERRDILLRFRGSGNQRILNVPESLRMNEAVWMEQEDWTGNPYGS